MNAANESNFAGHATPAKDPLSQMIAESIRQSFENGFATGIVRAQRIIAENTSMSALALIDLIAGQQPPPV